MEQIINFIEKNIVLMSIHDFCPLTVQYPFFYEEKRNQMMKVNILLNDLISNHYIAGKYRDGKTFFTECHLQDVKASEIIAEIKKEYITLLKLSFEDVFTNHPTYKVLTYCCFLLNLAYYLEPYLEEEDVDLIYNFISHMKQKNIWFF